MMASAQEFYVTVIETEESQLTVQEDDFGF